VAEALILRTLGIGADKLFSQDQEVEDRGAEHNPSPQIGVMIEVPAAVH
jgi:signal transduction protein with GAF and PtsI domain